MGYESTFSGSFTPDKPIPQRIADIINASDADLMVAGSDYPEYNYGDVYPESCSMRAYNFGEDLVRVQRLLLRHGIKLTGRITRVGEDGDDFELFEARNGRLRSRIGKIKYDRGTPLNASSVTRYSILAIVCPKKKDTSHTVKTMPVGWVGRANNHSLVPLMVINGVTMTDRPPPGAQWTPDRKQAEQVVRQRRREDKEHLYRIVTWEYTL